MKHRAERIGNPTFPKYLEALSEPAPWLGQFGQHAARVPLPSTLLASVKTASRAILLPNPRAM
jgi:hypothetical protein